MRSIDSICAAVRILILATNTRASPPISIVKEADTMCLPQLVNYLAAVLAGYQTYMPVPVAQWSKEYSIPAALFAYASLLVPYRLGSYLEYMPRYYVLQGTECVKVKTAHAVRFFNRTFLFEDFSRLPSFLETKTVALRIHSTGIPLFPSI